MNKSDRIMEKMVYVCPAVGEWVDGTFKAYPNERIDRTLSQLKASGLTLLNTEHVAPFHLPDLTEDENEPLRVYLKAAERNKLGALVFDDAIFKMLWEKDVTVLGENWTEVLDKRVCALREYSTAFRGFLLWDEMAIGYADTYSKIVSYLHKTYPDLLLRTSCLPLYAYRQEGLGADALTTNEEHKASKELTYRDYIWAFAEENEYFLYDWYPLQFMERRDNWEPRTRRYYVDEDWYYNLEYLANEVKARDYAFTTGVTIQACRLSGWSSNESHMETYNPERREDIGFSAYTAMAYGVREINYFNYEKHWFADNVLSGMVDADGNPTAVYDAVQMINAEIDRFADKYLAYDWRDTLDIPAAGSYIGHAGATDKGRLRMATVTGARTLIGHMVNQATTLNSSVNRDAYMLANAEGPRSGMTSRVTLEFEGAKTATVYNFKKGEKTCVDLTNGALILEIPVGEGILVTL